MHKDKYLAKISALMKEDGLDLSMDTIAERIGVTKKTLYNQFSSKEDLIDECINYMNDGLKAAISALADESIPASVGFCRGINGIKTEMFDISHVFLRDLQLVYPDKATRDHMVGTQLLEDMFRKNIEHGIASGEYRQDLDATLIARYIIYALFGFFKKEVMKGGGPWSVENYFSDMTVYHLNALKKID